MANDPPPRKEMSPQVRRDITKWIVQSCFGLAGYGLLLFLTAGRLDWLWGWVFLLVSAAVVAAHPLLLIPINPELLAERERGLRDKRVKAWDRRLAPVAGGMLVVAFAVAALDERFGWTGGLPLVAHLLGLAGHLLGYALFLWAMTTNAFFAEGVRIQEERGHTVATGGPYRAVRHPGYAGAILAALATPFLLGSLWAAIPAAVMAVLYGLRTWLEDRTLQAELPGYREYAGQVRHRLLPGVW